MGRLLTAAALCLALLLPSAAAAPEGDFYTLSSNYLTGSGFNTGDAWYSLENHLGYCLVTKTDYAAATRRVLCKNSATISRTLA